MKVTTTAATSFVHGNRKYEPGDPVETTKGEADELRAAGLVGDAPDAPEGPVSAPEDESGAEDMLGEGDAKMAETAGNKMEDAPKNKATTAGKSTKGK